MEDSGFATGGSASWDSTKTTDDAELPVASDEGAENCIDTLHSCTMCACTYIAVLANCSYY